MKELTIEQKAIPNGSVCPKCKGPSKEIDTAMGRLIGCERCGNVTRITPDGKAAGKLVPMETLRMMDNVAAEINGYLSGAEKRRFMMSVGEDMLIPFEHLTPYRMSMIKIIK